MPPASTAGDKDHFENGTEAVRIWPELVELDLEIHLDCAAFEDQQRTDAHIVAAAIGLPLGEIEADAVAALAADAVLRKLLDAEDIEGLSNFRTSTPALGLGLSG